MRMKIKELYGKYREIINYLIFGVLTTVVSLTVYFAVLAVGERVFGIVSDMESPDFSGTAYYALRLIGQILQWVSGVLFAFFTNRKWVFDAEDAGLWEQLLKFSASRLATLGLDTAVTFGMVAALNSAGFGGISVPLTSIVVGVDGVSKIVASVFVVIANYVISKFFVFKRKNLTETGYSRFF